MSKVGNVHHPGPWAASLTLFIIKLIIPFIIAMEQNYNSNLPLSPPWALGRLPPYTHQGGIYREVYPGISHPGRHIGRYTRVYPTPGRHIREVYPG